MVTDARFLALDHAMRALEPRRDPPKHLRGKPLADRLLHRVTKDDNGCWTWTGKTNSSGYAMLSVDGTDKPAHRVSYEQFVGPIPDGLQIDHLCRNRACVNPEHLEPVTLQENVRRGELARRSVCVRGHELSGDNLGNQANRFRVCKTCANERNRARYAKNRELLRLKNAQPAADALPVTVVPSSLDNCGYCDALDRFGDFATEVVRGTLIAVCDECAQS